MSTPSNQDSHVCPVCQGNGGVDAIQLEHLSYRRCASCGTISATQNGNADLHGGDYAQARGHGTDAAVTRAKRRTFLRYLKRLGDGRGRPLLEIGCSSGDGLLMARRLGWKVTGLELNADAVALGNVRLGGEVIRHSGLAEADLPEGEFDAAVLFDVLEHFADPRAALTKLRRLLRPGGNLLVVTPDADSLSAKLLGERWPHLLPEHRTLFTADSLRTLLHGQRFVVTEGGPALKHVSTGMFRRHAELYPHIFGARATRWMSQRLPEWVAPLYIGETYAIARSMAAEY